MKDVAVLVMAHGSPHREWMEIVESTVRQARLPLPARIGYLSGVSNHSIALEWAALEQSGARTIVAVPLFVSEGSTHLNEIQYMLGLVASPDVDTELKPIQVNARQLWCQPLEDDPQVQRILDERLQELVQTPSQEVLLVVGHGSDVPGFRERWQNLLHRTVLRLQRNFRFIDATYATLRPHTLTQQARNLAQRGRLLVLPMFVGEGYFTRTAIPKALRGVPHVYTGKTYLPHPLIADWLSESVQRVIETQERAW